MPVVNVLIENLKRECNPFEVCVWKDLDRPITREEIKEALDDDESWEEPTPSGYWWARDAISRKDHAYKIAWFVKNGFKDPIHLDVGVPVLGHYPHWLIEDGNHRFAAAIYAELDSILADVSGQVDYAMELLEVDISEEK